MFLVGVWRRVNHVIFLLRVPVALYLEFHCRTAEPVLETGSQADHWTMNCVAPERAEKVVRIVPAAKQLVILVTMDHRIAPEEIFSVHPAAIQLRHNRVVTTMEIVPVTLPDVHRELRRQTLTVAQMMVAAVNQM